MISRIIKLTGESQEIDFDPDKKNPYFYTKEGNVWIRNLYGGILFASLSAIDLDNNDTEGIMLILPDEVRLIVLDYRNKLYLKSDTPPGEAEIFTSDSKECPIMRSR